ncbi:MAG: YggS family pyridoxal phosphate-dependent enzyme [Myxococcales bacterium]|nr:YggS family pyridoxal phosphate-dependent enzyme [Myxococcales bacterium]
MSVAENLRAVRRAIAQAAERAGRDPQTVKLVAVTKTHPAALVQEAMAAGQLDFGENYVQELVDKAPLVGGDARWHFIGHLQRNKVKYLAAWIHAVHTVDQIALAEELAKRASAAGRRLPVLLQVNEAGEEAKSGCRPEEAEDIARAILALPSLLLTGLMTMPPFWPAEEVRPFFAALRRRRDGLQDKLGVPLPDLSMGMSADYAVAVEEGATLVRVGTAIFGQR